jgi:hypothetical protein
MALGNANNSAQSRGKNKPVIVKRRKEVVAAKGYNSITGSTRQSRSACSYRGSVDQTYYHNGRMQYPRIGDKIYFTRRAGSKFALEAGHYKIDMGRGAFVSISINSSGEVDGITSCR